MKIFKIWDKIRGRFDLLCLPSGGGYCEIIRTAKAEGPTKQVELSFNSFDSEVGLIEKFQQPCDWRRIVKGSVVLDLLRIILTVWARF